MTLHVLPDLLPSDATRFWNFTPKAEPDQCWEWQSTRNHRGYGKFWLSGRTDLAHRVSYRMHKGAIPKGFVVRHSCDNPPCVNPSHLLVGTSQDNARDAMDRGRLRRGVDNNKAKLTPTQVREIKEGWSRGETQVSLARRFDVSRACVQWILKGKSWRWLGDAA